MRKPGWFAFRQHGFLNTVRADGSDYFTVLGPGYNADHADHFHFDIMQRKNGYVACKLRARRLRQSAFSSHCCFPRFASHPRQA